MLLPKAAAATTPSSTLLRATSTSHLSNLEKSKSQRGPRIGLTPKHTVKKKRANPTAKWKAMQKAKNAKAYPQTRANQLKAIAEKTSTMPPLDISGGQRKDVALGANPAEKVSETLLTLPPMRNDLVTSRK
ncbi:unnamed protein product [Alternaria alternata]